MLFVRHGCSCVDSMGEGDEYASPSTHSLLPTPAVRARARHPGRSPTRNERSRCRDGAESIDRDITVSPQCRRVGLDISASELNNASPGSYDETWVIDITDHVPETNKSFSLIVMWQLLEHVKPPEAVVKSITITRTSRRII